MREEKKKIKKLNSASKSFSIFYFHSHFFFLFFLKFNQSSHARQY